MSRLSESEEQTLKAGGLAKPDCRPISRCGASEAIHRLDLFFEIVFTTGADRPTDYNGGKNKPTVVSLRVTGAAPWHHFG